MTALLTDAEIVANGKIHVTADELDGWSCGANFARSIYEARLAEDAKVRAGLVGALEWCRHLMEEEPKPLTHTNAYAMTLAALSAAKEVK